MAVTRGSAPRIVVVGQATAEARDPALAAQKRALSIDAVARHGAVAVPLDAAAPAAERAAALAAMDGLLLTGGPDLDPARYGAVPDGRGVVDPARDALDLEAWEAAEQRSVPVLGICRGLQVMNVFAGGRLLQHVEGHAGPAYGSGPPLTHLLRVVPGTRLARTAWWWWLLTWTTPPPTLAGNRILASRVPGTTRIGWVSGAPEPYAGPACPATCWSSRPPANTFITCRPRQIPSTGTPRASAASHAARSSASRAGSTAPRPSATAP